jgi:trehalose 6-phosphate synthase/phosphatase
MRRLEPEDLVAWYRLADLAVVIPVRDGMNLVAKEYVASRCDGKGALVLSSGAGAACELADALVVDSKDADGVAEAIHRALTMPIAETEKRMACLRRQVGNNTIIHWTGDILDELALLPVTKRLGKHALRHRNEIEASISGREIFLCLDFDGTLAPIVEEPDMAVMPDPIRTLLGELKQFCHIAVISGRGLNDLKKRVNLAGILYCGNHGMEMEGDSPAVPERSQLESFLKASREAFFSLPGARIEDKGMTASIHFRRVEPLLLEKFMAALREIARGYEDTLVVSEGRKVFEVRPRGSLTKGDVVRRLMDGIGKGKFFICLGDDRSDEDAFQAVKGNGLSISIGGGNLADYYLRRQGEVREFLEFLAGISLPRGHRRRKTELRKVDRK